MSAAVAPTEDDEGSGGEEQEEIDELEMYSSSDEEAGSDEEEEEDMSSLDTSKLKGRIRTIGQEEEKGRSIKDSRDQKRKQEMKSLLKEFKSQPEPEDKEKIKVHRRPCYGLRRWIGWNCCVHVPLDEAVLEGQSRQVRRFVRRWAKRKESYKMMNIMDKEGRTALSVALKTDREDMAETICSMGEVNVNLADNGTGLTPLHTAVQLDQSNAILTLSHRALLPDPKNDEGMTPLMLACYLGHIDCVRELIDVNADPEKKDKRGWQALHYAAAGEGSTEVIQFLLKECGVPARKKDKTGRRPIDWAKLAGNGEAEFTLEQHKVTLYD
jgi:ankyrin repeat protein